MLTWVAVVCVLAIAVVSVLALRMERPRPDFRARGDMARADAFTRGLLARHRMAPERLSDDEVIALGYLERLRMGLGSPFRLMDYALHDPRLSPEIRQQAAMALLRSTAEGQAYRVDPAALTALLPAPSPDAGAAVRRHLALIERAIASADDPAVGELAVRTAYVLAEAELLVSPQGPRLAAQAAALLRDREQARRDAVDLLEAATREERHPLALVQEWRAARRFRVEAPPAAQRTVEVDVAGARAALPLAAEVARIAGATSAPAAPDTGRSLPLMGVTTGKRLSQIALRQQPPPQAPIRVAVDRWREPLLRELARAGFRQSSERLVERGGSEELFAAEHARLASRHSDPLLARTALEAAVAMRAYAQEQVWFPGFPAPSEAELKAAYGIGTVQFADDVPLAWQPYYRRMLGHALADLETVLPNLDLRGLSFRFAPSGREGEALALHEPGARTIVLPPGSGAGAIAHEVAHDLDWQVGRRRFGRRGTYGTDLALQAAGADRFAAAVRGLPAPPASHVSGEARRRFENRPAETFARLFDGYVSSTLAARGRSNGYLSSFQDEVLTGHGTAVPPGSGKNTETFLPLLMEASPLSEPLQAEILRLWGPGRRPGLLESVRDVTSSPAGPAYRAPLPTLVDRDALPLGTRVQIARVLRRRGDVLAARRARVCASPVLWLGAGGEAALRRAVDEAAEARIRGILRLQAGAWGLDADPRVLREAWVEPLPPAPGSDPSSSFPAACPTAVS